MRKIIFSGVCILTSVIGVMAMIFASLKGYDEYGSINGSTNILIYLNRFGLTPIFITFCLLGILGLGVGLWGIFDKNNLK